MPKEQFSNLRKSKFFLTRNFITFSYFALFKKTTVYSNVVDDVNDALFILKL